METEEIKAKLTRRKKTKKHKDNTRYVSTGSTLLNLACTDHPDRGFRKGHYYLLVGTSSSGKTWLSLSCMAEASINPNFNGYRFILDDVERGALMNIRKFFGSKVDQRLETIHSYKIEDFYDNLDKANKKGKPFIYVLDSMDGLSSEAELAKFAKTRKAREKEKETAGSYGDGKAKVNSQSLRQALTPLKQSGSILIIINQNRDKLTGFGGKTRSGGNAMQYYACLEIWSDKKKELTKVYKGKDRQQGTLCSLRVRKNRVKGATNRYVQVPIYRTYGMDDVGSCIDYLISEKHWTKTKSGIINAPEFDFEGKRSKLINAILDNNNEVKLSRITANTWKEIENAIAIKRKPRYV